MARRMAGPGLVTVSLRRSTTWAGTPARLPDPRACRTLSAGAAAPASARSMAETAPGSPLAGAADPFLGPAAKGRSRGVPVAQLPTPGSWLTRDRRAAPAARREL